jgi:hypothetical protein
VSRNLWHSCVRISLADHFVGKPPLLRDIFRRVRAAVRACGPATCYAQRSRIVFQTRVRFAGVVVRRHWLDLGLWLHRRVRHPALVRVESFGRLGYGHHFRIAAAGDLDPALAALIAEAYGEALRPPPRGRRATSQPAS